MFEIGISNKLDVRHSNLTLKRDWPFLPKIGRQEQVKCGHVDKGLCYNGTLNQVLRVKMQVS